MTSRMAVMPLGSWTRSRVTRKTLPWKTSSDERIFGFAAGFEVLDVRADFDFGASFFRDGIEATIKQSPAARTCQCACFAMLALCQRECHCVCRFASSGPDGWARLWQ